MYELRGYENVQAADHDRQMRENGYARMERREVVRTFRTAMGMLRFCVNNGAFRNVVRGGPLDRVYLGRDGQGPGSDYQVVDAFFRFKITGEHLTAMRRAHARYLAALHYWREIEPEWREGASIPYMDNSVERVDTDKYGNKRRVTLTPPSGDICF